MRLFMSWRITKNYISNRIRNALFDFSLTLNYKFGDYRYWNKENRVRSRFFKNTKWRIVDFNGKNTTLNKKKDAENEFQSMSVEELNKRIDKSMEDSKNGKLTKSSDLITEIKEWT